MLNIKFQNPNIKIRYIDIPTSVALEFHMAETHTKKHPDDLVERVDRTVAQHEMFGAGDKVLLAVSGGPDSMALMHIIHELAPAYGLQLGVAHLNHGLRPQAAESDAAFVHQQARQYHLTCHIEKKAIERQGGSLEERAREARYAFFERISAAHGYTKIALGHQADDNAEAVLLHLLRGSGLRGLAGIPPVRGARYIRPLIQLRRTEILAYLERRHIPFVEDSSNEDQRFTRNRIRHDLLPLLQRDYNTNLVGVLNRMATLCRDEESWLETLLLPLVDKACIHNDRRFMELSTEVLNPLPHAAQRRVLREALRRWRGNLRRMGADHIEALIELLAPARLGRTLDLPGFLRARRTRQGVEIWVNRRPRGMEALEGADFVYHINSEQCLPLAMDICEAGCRLKFTCVASPDLEMHSMSQLQRVWFDLDRITFPLIIRNFRPGDRLSPFGMAGTQKLKKLFSDRKIDRSKRPHIPLLVSKEGILWVAGVRRSTVATLSAATTHALQVKMNHLYDDHG